MANRKSHKDLDVYRLGRHLVLSCRTSLRPRESAATRPVSCTYSAMLVHAGPELDIHANKHNVVNKRSNQKHYLVRNKDRENIKRED